MRYPLPMAFAVFLYRADSIYHDSPAERYQFPRQYLARAQQAVGDWIIYYEPKSFPGSRGYFAAAKVQAVIPDPGRDGMYLAVIEPGSYLDFADPVPFNSPDGPTESGLLAASGRLSGNAQSAVRSLSPGDFRRIVDWGLADEEGLLPRADPSLDPQGVYEERAPFVFEQERDRVETLMSRPIRDRVFRKIVLKAYGERCAVTGLRLINGGGRAEVEAAHIRPVSAKGPDVVSNGLALSGTAHWMFDRGLISLADDLSILISRQVNDRAGIEAMVNSGGRALVPAAAAQRPHPHFLAWHRDYCFKR